MFTLGRCCVLNACGQYLLLDHVVVLKGLFLSFVTLERYGGLERINFGLLAYLAKPDHNL